MSDAAKWSLFDLLKTLDSIHAGEFHDEFARAAQGLGLELPAVAPPPDPASGSEETDSEADNETDGEQASEQDRVYEFLAGQTEPVSLAKIIAELGLKKWSATSSLTRLQRKGLIQHAGYDAWRARDAE